jgi:hypothetical protein
MSGSLNPTHGEKVAGLRLVFGKSGRPSRHAVSQLFRKHGSISVSFDPAMRRSLRVVGGRDLASSEQIPDYNPGNDSDWLELLFGGMTYDLEGFAPGDSVSMPYSENTYDLKRAPSASDHSALLLRPGPHLSGGHKTIPVLRGMVAVARELIIGFPEMRAVIWRPARSAMGVRYFESIASAWLDGGPFPALGLVSYRATMDGGLQSIGLGYWLDCELRIEPELASDKVYATRLSTRLVNHLLSVAEIDQEQGLITSDGQRILLRRSRNRSFIRVSRE